jgi:hypothetical protein
MKKSMIVLLFVFAIIAFSTNMVFATSDPIPGVDIIVKKNPGGIVVFRGQSGRDGKFACKLEEGNYELQLSYDQIKRVLSAKNKNYDSNPKGCKIELIFEGETANVKVPAKVLINKETGTINISVAKKSGIGFMLMLSF